jgi:hypothetical protein
VIGIRKIAAIRLQYHIEASLDPRMLIDGVLQIVASELSCGRAGYPQEDFHGICIAMQVPNLCPHAINDLRFGSGEGTVQFPLAPAHRRNWLVLPDGDESATRRRCAALKIFSIPHRPGVTRSLATIAKRFRTYYFHLLRSRP